MKLRTGQIHTVGSKPAPAAAAPIADEAEVVESVEASEPAAAPIADEAEVVESVEAFGPAASGEEPVAAEAASAGEPAAESATEEE
jgi:hypothetical protein